MAPTTQNPNSKKVREVHEFDATPSMSTKGPTTPRTSTYSSWILTSSSPATTTTTISSPSPSPSPSPSSSSSSSAAAATAQKQQPPQPLDVTPSVISNFVVTGTDASFVGFTTTPTGGGTGEVIIQVSSPSPSPSPASESETTATTAAQDTTAGRKNTAVTTTTTPPQAAGDNLTPPEEEEQEKGARADAEAVSRSRIKRQTEAARSVIGSWLGIQEGGGKEDTSRE